MEQSQNKLINNMKNNPTVVDVYVLRDQMSNSEINSFYIPVENNFKCTRVFV